MFIDVPVDSKDDDYVYCQLNMRESGQTFVFRVATSMGIGQAAEFLAKELLPNLRFESYEWTFLHKNTELSVYHSFKTSDIRTRDVLYLIGNHKRPRLRPLKVG